jgi:DNA-binding NtrC family response regulator
MKVKPEWRQPPIAKKAVVLLGDLSSGAALLSNVIQEFGWSLEQVSNFENLRKLLRDRSVVAVLFEPKSLGISWSEALRLVLEIAPEALPMVCQRFSETVIWPDLAEAGAFHSLSLPLDARELRQSLGFVWTAKGAATAQRFDAAAVA